MAASPPKAPDIVVHGDHEVITPDTRALRRTARAARPDEPDQVRQAELALAQLAEEFAGWMSDECERLDAARRRVRAEGHSAPAREALFLAAHDMKSYSDTLGFPEARPLADSLCRLLEHAPDFGRVPAAMIDQHVDAVRAVVREHTRADFIATAATLTLQLRAATDEFLVAENRDRPDVLRILRKPAHIVWNEPDSSEAGRNPAA